MIVTIQKNQEIVDFKKTLIQVQKVKIKGIKKEVFQKVLVKNIRKIKEKKTKKIKKNKSLLKSQ